MAQMARHTRIKTSQDALARVNKQGPRRGLPPKFYLVKKSSPGTVSSANSGVAPQYRFEALSSKKQEQYFNKATKNIITTTGIGTVNRAAVYYK
eukprot:scaffold676_cov137-Skeletonema_marinoi.AAC.1